MTTDDRFSGTSLTRRKLLGTSAAGVAALGMARHAGAQDAAAVDPIELIELPEPTNTLPTESVDFRWVDSGGIKADLFRPLFQVFQERTPNIEITYDILPWPEIAEVVPLGVRGGNAHDVFQLPLNVSAAQAVAEGWVAPLADAIPNFDAWKAAFPPGVFLEGITDFGGVTYTFPIHSSKRYATLLFYNRAYMDAAGYDPATTPLTWDELRDAARKITEAGAGEYYGLVIAGNQVNRFSEYVGNMARMAGAAAMDLGGSLIDYRTGEFIYTSDQIVAAIELLLAINDDGSVFPGSLSLNAQEKRAQFTSGIAGMMMQGPWVVPDYRTTAPDFDFGMASSPVPNDRQITPLSVGPAGGADTFWIFSDSPHKAIAGELLAYIGTEEAQIAYQKITDSATGVIYPAANAVEGGDPLSLRALEIYDEQMRIGPDPRVRNPETAAFYTEFRPSEPTFGQVIQGLFVGQLDDVREAMQDLQDRTEAEFERAIAAAQENGAQISRDDFVFANWDPTRDYTEEDYAAL